LKELSRMEKKMDFLLGGMEMERKSMKELTRMGKKFLLRSGTKMVCKGITMIRFTKIQQFIENQKTDKIHSTKEQTSVTVE